MSHIHYNWVFHDPQFNKFKVIPLSQTQLDKDYQTYRTDLSNWCRNTRI